MLDRAEDSRSKRGPNPVDIHVGGRIKLRRMVVGLSQEKLADKMGLTFQQIQKYEKGINRCGASRLFQISQILGAPVQSFFENAPGVGIEVHDEPGTETFILDFLHSNEGIELNRAFVKINDTRVRKRIVELVRALSPVEIV